MVDIRGRYTWYYPFWSFISNDPAVFVLNSCIVFCERRFVRTFDLQKGFSLSVSLGGSQWWLWERVGLGPEDLKSFGAPLPLGQKHTFWNRTGNFSLIKRNALTTEPRMRIWHVERWIIAIIKSKCKKNSQPEKHVESQFGCSPCAAHRAFCDQAF